MSAAHAIQLQLAGEPLPGVSDEGAGANTPRDSGASNFDTAFTPKLPRTPSSAQLTRTFSSAFSVIDPGGGHAAPATSASTPAMRTSASASSISHQPTMKPPTRKRSSLAISDMSGEGGAPPEQWEESPLSMLCAAALPQGSSASPARGDAGAAGATASAGTGARGKATTAAAKAAATGLDTDEEREAKRLRRVQANRESARNTIRRKKAQYEQLSKRAAQLDVRSRTTLHYAVCRVSLVSLFRHDT